MRESLPHVVKDLIPPKGGPCPITDGTAAIGKLSVELGGTIDDVVIDYRIYGLPTDRADNVVLFPHMYSGAVSSLERLIGRGRPLDPTRYCIVVPGQLGNGVSTSPSNAGSASFPELTVGDDFVTQLRLLEHLGLHAPLCLVIGYSMGACQAYEWAVRCPERVSRVMAIAGNARTPPRAAALIELLARTLEAQPPETGLDAHARLWSRLGVSPEVYGRRLWRQAGFTSAQQFVRVVFQDDFARKDPRDLLCQLRKWQRADVSRLASGDLPGVLGRIAAHASLITLAGDPFCTIDDCSADSSMIRQSRVRVIRSPWGHYAFSGFDERDHAAIDAAIYDLLECGS